ncbi:hypothetical protein MCOR25_007066 [Pyricularia grisea]|nr:hypothetical protein MCOR25_007066 [Pyricularia grisea]
MDRDHYQSDPYQRRCKDAATQRTWSPLFLLNPRHTASRQTRYDNKPPKMGQFGFLNDLVWTEPKAPAVKGAISPEDALNARIFGFLWLGSVYGIAMIWWALALLSRWDRSRETGAGSVLLAFMLSTAWPVVMVYLIANPI